MALLVAAFVATAGVAFAVGRWTMPSSSTAAPSLPGAGEFSPFAGSALPAAAIDDSSTDGAAVDRRAAAAAAGITAVDPAALASPGVGTVPAGITTDVGNGLPAAGGLPAGTLQAPGAPPGGADGSSPGGMGQGPGMGPGGLEGTVSAIGGDSLTLTTDDGTSMSVVTDPATTWVQETPIAATDIQAGDRVSVEMPFGGFGRGQADTERTLVAEQVTLLPE